MHLGGTFVRGFKKWGSCGGPEVSQTLDFRLCCDFLEPPLLQSCLDLGQKMDLGLLLLRGHKKYIAQGLTVFGPD